MRSFLAILIASIIAASALAQVVPSWWYTRNVFEPNSAPDDYAAVNQGQLKNFAREAFHEFVHRLPGDWSQSDLASLIQSWDSSGEAADDYQVVTVTQLKELLTYFYAALDDYRLNNAPGWRSVAYPWGVGVGNDSPAEDEVVNIGQVKQAFLGLQGNRRAFGTYALSALGNAAGQSGTGLTGERFAFGLDWMDDTDGDGVLDIHEIVAGTDPNSSFPDAQWQSQLLDLQVFPPYEARDLEF
jgi:hypothetical protein